jgi:hypothetical protein
MGDIQPTQGLIAYGLYSLARVSGPGRPMPPPRPAAALFEGVRAVAPLQSAKTVTYPVRQMPAVFLSRRVSPVASVHPVVAVSPGVAVLAVSRAVAVSPVLAMRWLSFVHEGFSSSNGIKWVADSEHPGSGMSKRKPFQGVDLKSGRRMVSLAFLVIAQLYLPPHAVDMGAESLVA